jgi:hypothetical protein
MDRDAKSCEPFHFILDQADVNAVRLPLCNWGAYDLGQPRKDRARPSPPAARTLASGESLRLA